MTSERHEDDVIARASDSEPGPWHAALHTTTGQDSDALVPASEGRFWPGEWRLGKPIAEAARQQQVLESLCALQAAGVAYDPHSHERLGPVQLREDGTLLVAPGIGRRRLLLQLASYHAAYCVSWESSAGFNPSSLRMYADRVQRRTGVSSRVRVQFTDPFGGTATGTVVDVSSGGLGITVERHASMLAPGDQVRDCRITWKGGPELRLDVRVARVSHEGGLTRVGLRFSVRSDDWQELIEELQFPDTVRGAADAGRVWSAYVASGYLNISGKESCSFDQERPAFCQAQELLSASPEVGAIFAGGRRAQPEAYIHHVQAWPGAWINVHLCRLARGRTLRTSDDGILLRLYEHCYGFAMARPETRWLVTYTHSQDTAYSHRLHCDFAKGLPVSRGCVVPFEPIEILGATALASSELAIAPATSAELNVVGAALRARFPLPYLESMALANDDLGIEAMGGVWRGSGLERARLILVSRRSGLAVAAAVLDFASSGMHVYGLLDKVRLVQLEPGGCSEFDALLAAAHGRYVASGQGKFIYFRELEAPAVSSSLQHSSLGKANINVVARDQFGSFLEHVFLLHARTLNHTRADGRSYSVLPPRISAARGLIGKSRADALLESQAWAGG